jgi:hypothetical protein
MESMARTPKPWVRITLTDLFDLRPPTVRLRAALIVLLRQFGLKCLAVENLEDRKRTMEAKDGARIMDFGAGQAGDQGEGVLSSRQKAHMPLSRQPIQRDLFQEATPAERRQQETVPMDH